MKLVNGIFLINLLLCACQEFVPPSKPNYADLETKESSRIHLQPEFIDACQQMAGFYKDPTKNPALAKTIMMGGINYSYRDFYHNFKCYTDRLGIKFLPISLDKNIYTYLTASKTTPSFMMPDIPGRLQVDSHASGFGGDNFNLIGCRKLEAVGGALRLGYDVVFSDVDIALVSDPIKWLFFEGVDYVHSDNEGCLRKWSFNATMEGNTGFYAVKSNPKTIRTFDLAYKACSQVTAYDDQTMFWLILRTNLDPAPEPLVKCPPVGGTYTPVDANRIISCPLDNCVFSASNLRNPQLLDKLAKALRAKNEPAVMAHANWMNGKEKKKAALRMSKLWLTQKVGGFIERPQLELMGNWTCTYPQKGSVLFDLAEK